ncbi:PTS system mannose/fructose/sorbose family transporter subunit IID [Niallia circulans]|uniref:PTS system mannose/fructose/sorbose family transporter subunit IID n=1 Tax=Niallia circulans TaxID=1397 RepID=UPI0026F2E38E|nr:PTS system mannose/fructose/sorbose family transporter subunit IID [Niallia circulans]
MQKTSNDKDIKLSKKDLRSVFWRSLTMEWSWNFERQQHMGFAFSMLPIIGKLYKNKEDRAAATKRHLEFFNTAPYLSTLILGITTSMEEKNANSKNFDTTSISNIKVALMGPVAGIGDSFFWGTLRVLATGIGASLALNGNILGPILFLLLFNIPHYIIRYLLMIGGYKFGTKILDNFEKSGLMRSITYGASILGLMVIGGMTASLINLQIGGSFGEGETKQTVQGVLDGIVPGILSIAVVFLVLWLLKRGVKVTYILLGTFVLGIIGAWTGFLIA